MTDIKKHTTPVFKKDQPDDTNKFQPLPNPTGRFPYHLQLENIIADVAADKLVFHMAGDTGSLVRPEFQRLVASAMANQISGAEQPADQPKFLFHLGDVVYNFGEAECYPVQFFEPYEVYPAPVFAIAGNHDSDVNPDNPVPYHSLNAFVQVFCSPNAQPVPFSGGAKRLSNVQPNVYWTLETPLANIIGLHSNVPKFGVLKDDQLAWFVQELKWAKQHHPEKALLVCVHHAPYSADINHGSSEPVIRFLDRACNQANVLPDAVFSGHVHDYQRMHKHYPDGKVVPFIVAGAGGYDQLHAIAALDDDRYTAESALFKDISLENYCTDQHGFLRVTLEKQASGVHVIGEYFTLINEAQGKADLELVDRFVVEVNAGLHVEQGS
ncbi:metallophosphoesterase [Mucilaginibacter sp. RS28]|uniref:Metallophosphoesterase n=1 Tax=Mucilaginibacter straminoryzae TaxID=2932774 RepID=A0A9X1X1R2_9SPHI|nr:metallophosphoesterase [Mucilaginibacter straminoryzae]MCJ8209046.1 metallophosphoesterase [Mucilaginibacter straminoryzae]